MADIFTSEIAISELPTKSVTLTPHRATVVREIRTTIQPGANELTIVDLDPNIDPDSIRVEGTGSATITDIQTATVARTEQFDDVYPPDDDDDDDDSLASSSEDSDSDDDDDEELAALRAAVTDAETRLARARNDKASAESSLDFLDGYGRALRPEHSSAEEVGAFLALYARQRAADASAHHDAVAKEAKVAAELEELKGRLRRREEKRAKARRAQRQAQRREKQLARRKRAQRREQAARRRDERRAFWTGQMGRVVVRLDGDIATPVSEAAPSGKNEEEEGRPVVLVLRYVLPRARWAPRYELSVRTPTASAHLVYRAEYFNSSAETWRDAAVTLSTSEAAWSRLDEEVPVLTPWHIRLDAMEASETAWNGILEKPVVKGGGSLFGPPPPPRMKTGGLFGNAPSGGFGNAQPRSNLNVISNANTNTSGGSGSLFGSRSQPPPPPPPPPPAQALFGVAQSQPALTPSAFGAPAAPQPAGFALGAPAPEDTEAQQPDPTPSSFGAAAPEPVVLAASAPPPGDTDAPEEILEDDDYSILSQTLEHRDSVKHNYGMTTTYALPGTRTIEPSHHGRRHVLAELDLHDVTLSHLIVPKKRAAAFLRARVKNTSTVKLLRGRVGLTVDGIFLGSSMLGACAPDANFQVSLGVDPAIAVAYAKPLVRRVPGGFFASEDAALFRRSCWVKNNKGVAVDLVVSDQVPVSQDEKLRVNLVEPKLENKEGMSVKIKMDKETGSGEATMLKDGEVKWAIRLEPGKEFRVVLEYETRRLVR